MSLFASGSEVEIAVAAQKQLAERGIAARVVSVPSLELLLAQPAERQQAIIGNAPVNVAIEAAVRWGWDAVIGKDGEFIGMHSFGASAPAKDLFKHFGITAEAAVNAVLRRLALTVVLPGKKDYQRTIFSAPARQNRASAQKPSRGRQVRRGDDKSY